MRLANKAAVITGGASGFGRATAIRFAREGARVMVLDLNGQGAASVAEEIRTAGGEALSRQVDVTRADQVDRAWRDAADLFGRLDVVFNNAGIPQAFTPVEETSEDLFSRLLTVHVLGVFHGCRAAIPIMRKQGAGVILNTCSTAGIRPRPGLAAYAASKGAAIAFTKALALEVAPHGIRAVAICPVAAETPMLAGFIGDRDPQETRAAFIRTVPLGRLNLPDDVANAAVFLASDEAAMVTGTAFEVDGGRDV
jgi:3-oxoacyl-[acyl-carrier protein] reductase